MTANEAAALWWKEKFLTVAKAQKFHDCLLNLLDQLKREWILTVGKPGGVLSRAIEATFSAGNVPHVHSLFPDHLAMENRDGVLWIREGAAKPWHALHW